jgi:hypothetical protein
MKNILILLILGLAASCTNSTEEDNQLEDVISAEKIQAKISEPKAKKYWYYKFDKESKTEYIIKGLSVDSTLRVEKLIPKMLNERKSYWSIEYYLCKKDTFHLKVLPDITKYEQMHDSIPTSWLAETIFTLTELDSVNFVNVEVQVENHVSEGVYDREDFKELKIVEN